MTCSARLLVEKTLQNIKPRCAFNLNLSTLNFVTQSHCQHRTYTEAVYSI